MDGRTLAPVALALACVAPLAATDECEAALDAAYKAARDTYSASQSAHEEAASDAKAAALVLKLVGGKHREISIAKAESAEATNDATQAARTSTASLKVAHTMLSRVAIEQAVDATLQAFIHAERALEIAKENASHETGPVQAKASSAAERADVAARTTRNAAEVCLSSEG